MEIVFTFLISVMAGVVANIISKWLDEDYAGSVNSSSIIVLPECSYIYYLATGMGDVPLFSSLRCSLRSSLLRPIRMSWLSSLRF